MFVRKNAFLEWKRIEKRKGRSFRKEETYFFLKSVRRRIVKQKFVFTNFLSIWRATTRRVNIKIRHERDSNLSRNSKVKNKESQVFFFLQKCSSWKEENRKMRKGRSSRKEKTFFVRFFLETICEGESLNTRIYFYNILVQKKANRNLFCFWKSTKESKEERFQQ